MEKGQAASLPLRQFIEGPRGEAMGTALSFVPEYPLEAVSSDFRQKEGAIVSSGEILHLVGFWGGEFWEPYLLLQGERA